MFSEPISIAFANGSCVFSELVLLPQNISIFFAAFMNLYLQNIFLDVAVSNHFESIEVNPVKIGINNIHRYIKQDKVYKQSIMPHAIHWLVFAFTGRQPFADNHSLIDVLS